MFLVVFIMFVNLISVKADSQYIDNRGCIKGELTDVIKILNIDLNLYRIDKSLPTNHISNAYNFLKNFYQEDREFYRKGGKSQYIFTIEQAQDILQLIRGSYALFKTQDPVKKITADVIICAGLERSMEKRFYSLKKFVDEGYKYENLFFMSRTQELENCCKNLVEKQHKFFSNIKVYFLRADDKISYEDFIVKVKPFISKEFYIVSDPEYAFTLQEAFTKYGAQHGLICLGVFARPIVTDPLEYAKQDIKAYKYDEFIVNKDDQIIAAAYSSLNILAHQVDQQMKLFEQEQTQRK
jgi:hypothetical protein